MIPQKVKAFTLSELMVVLVVSSIVVTIAFLALSSIQKQVRNIQYTYEKQQEIQYLERVLFGDLNSYEGIYDDTKKKLFFENTEDSLQYHFLKDVVVRNGDTIPLKLTMKQLYLHGEEVKKGVIDAIELEFSDTFSTNTVFVYKKNDASHYIDTNGI
ncbi:prepilin-type N-terminal cleavage/methylation domain-containing protein [Flavobacteriaceae bacterium S356]|uniref:Prepilin-type N-terminal cleavage/methylation domain-containing protein n=1 Tax=Asprobacillus argus TaxID=3076534 RepID=A0ABU3LD50_9FLAO|nr:prepilin-type N-terminal cleavage/methylation domain-containing protein [Flavobacteriaceae bacterium S356]